MLITDEQGTTCITGDKVSIETAAKMIGAGLQVRQKVTVEVKCGPNVAHASLPNAHNLADVVAAFVALTRKSRVQ